MGPYEPIWIGTVPCTFQCTIIKSRDVQEGVVWTFFLLFSSFTPPEKGRNMWASQALWLCESSIWYKNREIQKMRWYCVQWCRTLTIDSIVTWYSVDSWKYILWNNMKQSASSCLRTLHAERVSFRNGHRSSGTGMMDVGRRTCL